jgi:lysophospholipase L1-like esterase
MARRSGNPIGPFTSLVVLGESTVQGGGWLRNRHERWADILHRLLETAQEARIRYHNAGLGASVVSPASPGYEASNKPSAAERLDREVIRHRPDLLVIAYGLNDMRAGMPVDAFAGEMRGILRRVRKRGNPLIVLANVYHMTTYGYYPPFDRGSAAAHRRYNRMLRDLAASAGCAYADVWSAEGGKGHVVHLDTVHANKIGNMLIAHKVFEAIVHAAPGMARHVNRRDAKTAWSRKIRAWQGSCVEKSG